MKLRELIQRVDRSKKNECYADIDDFIPLFGLSIYGYHSEFEARVKEYNLFVWQCTDTWVGVTVFYMDDEPVATSIQKARKSDKDIRFVSKEAAEKVRNFIVSLQEPEESGICIADLEQEMGTTMNVTYSGQLLVDSGFYMGQPVVVVKRYDAYEDINKWQTVDVRLPDGTITNIPMSEFDIPYRLVPA